MNWDSFEILSTDTPGSITWASRGGDGSGKSYFGCTAPGPIFVAGFDPHGMSRVDPEIREGKDIRIGRYGFAELKALGDNRDEIKKAAQAIWDRFTSDYIAALPHIKTCLWDREDLAWELLRYASWGTNKTSGSKTAQLDFGDLNAEYVGLIQMAKDRSVNLGLLQGLQEEWISKFNPQKGVMERHNSGRMVPDGFKKVRDHVDITLDHRWDSEQREYITKIDKFPNKDWKDQDAPNLTFPLMASMAFPTTTPEDWQ